MKMRELIERLEEASDKPKADFSSELSRIIGKLLHKNKDLKVVRKNNKDVVLSMKGQRIELGFRDTILHGVHFKFGVAYDDMEGDGNVSYDAKSNFDAIKEAIKKSAPLDPPAGVGIINGVYTATFSAGEDSENAYDFIDRINWSLERMK